jgi:hypothetical protein
VQRAGKGYRYPQAGWIVVHIEGEPYERGYQHGKLLAPEIVEYLTILATKRGKENPGAHWNNVRTLTNALFLRRYDPEYLEEMKGIADGAAAADAKFDRRPLDLIDIVAINSDIELEFLDSALEATGTGLEGKVFKEPVNAKPKAPHEEHCSAFAATGPATADGKIVFGHITMFNLAFVRYFNVWLDIKPSKGHRVLMQTYPGGIQSGLDYYMNDAGLLVTETTIAQTKFDINGDALASRIRKTLQYASSIDEAVAILAKSNNGLYSNEWLLGDIKTNEIAMFELGTHKTKLWRSSKDEWFGGTKGFYWGCNNAKDLDVRLETVPSLKGQPHTVVWAPSDRDSAWVKLFEKHKGKIGESFGFEAFTTPPLAAFASLDAKFTTSNMAKELKTHALFGNPLGRTWEPTEFDKKRVPSIRPLVSNDWTILTADAPAQPDKNAKVAIDIKGKTHAQTASNPEGDRPPIWHGTILAATPADTWLAAAFANYEHIVSLEHAFKVESKSTTLTKAQQDHIDLAKYRHASKRWLATLQLGKDVPLSETTFDLTQRAWYELAAAKGIEVLESVRGELGDEKFLAFMDAFGRKHAGQKVTTAAFLDAAEAALHKPIKATTHALITEAKQPTEPSWAVDSFETELDKTIIVYGALKEAVPQRETAERLQRLLARRWPNIYVKIQTDESTTDADLKAHHILAIGRPQTNSVLQKLATSLPVSFGTGSFQVDGETYAHASSAVLATGPNPLNPRYSVVAFSGLGNESMWHSIDQLPRRQDEASNVLVLAVGSSPRAIVVKAARKPAAVSFNSATNK